MRRRRVLPSGDVGRIPRAGKRVQSKIEVVHGPTTETNVYDKFEPHCAERSPSCRVVYSYKGEARLIAVWFAPWPQASFGDRRAEPPILYSVTPVHGFCDAGPGC